MAAERPVTLKRAQYRSKCGHCGLAIIPKVHTVGRLYETNEWMHEACWRKEMSRINTDIMRQSGQAKIVHWSPASQRRSRG